MRKRKILSNEEYQEELLQQYLDEERVLIALRCGLTKTTAIMRRTGIPRARVERAWYYLRDVGAV